ncbi:hypothetical protein H2203_009284 [Taxawa tesnikishii (nom. ined.)]|nr:hypothetical protein H2203_009284 [Dothideales sp. JES 119]
MSFCKSSELGSPIKIDEAEDYISGYVLMNDWSVRDVQAWDPWVVLADALESFKIPAMYLEVH